MGVGEGGDGVGQELDIAVEFGAGYDGVGIGVAGANGGDEEIEIGVEALVAGGVGCEEEGCGGDEEEAAQKPHGGSIGRKRLDG